MKLHLWSIGLLPLLFLGVAAIPALAQGRKGGGNNNNTLAKKLPGKFSALTNDQAKEAGLLSELAVLWIGDIREPRGNDPVVDLFGPFGGQRPEVDEDDVPAGQSPPPVVEENER